MLRDAARRYATLRYATLCYATRRYAAQLYANLQTPGPSDSIKVNQGQSATTPPRRRRVPQNDATRRCATLRDAAFDFLLHRRPSPSFSFSTEPPIETTMSHRRRLPLSWWFFSSSMERPRASRLIIVFFECLDDDDGDDDDGNDSDYRVGRSEGPSETVSLHITNSFRTPLRGMNDDDDGATTRTSRKLLDAKLTKGTPRAEPSTCAERGRASTLTSLYVSSMIEEVFTADANAMYLQGCLTLLQIETLTCNHRRIILKTIAKATTERTTTMTRLCESPASRRSLRRDVGLPRTSRHEYIRHGADMEYETTHRWVKTPSRIFQ